ncbi:MAG TPA: HDOD domain-containing protein [Syntrophorhabdaceae bacterium]|nr:HDOD domain-containing protein [Syntrophorhabdaceae bacterium]
MEQDEIAVAAIGRSMINDFALRLERIIDFLPPIPVIMTELMQTLADENADMNDLAKIISKDPSMSVNVLKIANSAFYRLPYKVATVDHAVRMLGLKEISMICISCGAYHALMPARGAQTFNLEDFWKHSVATGAMTRKICSEFHTGDRSIGYFLGLLHDIGKIILDRFAHDIYTIVIQTTFEECISMIEAEKRLIGESHDVIGAFVMNKWKFPEVFADAAKYHHSVAESPEHNRTMIAAVALADQLARVRCFGFGGDMGGVVLSETEPFRILQTAVPAIAELDIFKFVNDLETMNDEITEMEKLLVT